MNGSSGDPALGRVSWPPQGSRFTEALLDRITTCLVTADWRGRISFANRMARETLGIAGEECLGRSVVEVFGGDPALVRALGSLSHPGEMRLEFAFQPRNGLRIELGMTVLRSGGDGPEGMDLVLLFRDLGERRQMEIELRRVERLSAIGNMVAGFAHEVRNPLAAIQGLVEAFLAESALEDPRREYAVRVLSLLTRVERFVKASLEYAEPKPPAILRHDPAGLVIVAIEALAPRWAGGATPPLSVEPDLPEVEVDKAQIVECLLALLENALDATGDAQRVSLRVALARSDSLPGGAGPVVAFEVRDDGPGIPGHQLSRVFDPFYTTKPRGTGLGLALAQTLVRENGGHFQVRSVPGVETTFTLLLPGAVK